MLKFWRELLFVGFVIVALTTFIIWVPHARAA